LSEAETHGNQTLSGLSEAETHSNQTLSGLSEAETHSNQTLSGLSEAETHAAHLKRAYPNVIIPLQDTQKTMSQATITLQLDTDQQLHLDRIAIELACDRADLIKHAIDAYLANYQPKRAAFGVLSQSGKIIGDILEPITPTSDWEALQ
jgi:hypothetical protein